MTDRRTLIGAALLVLAGAIFAILAAIAIGKIL